MAEVATVSNEAPPDRKAKNVICYSNRKRFNKYYWRNKWNDLSKYKTKKDIISKYVLFF
jgi:hypothetical protein